MAGQHFDPYHEWLGIPPAEQPPNYYRLLGLAEFETNPRVIQNAADRQMEHIRRFAIGQRSRDSQVIANYIAAAAGTLLDDTRKVEYDAWLFAAYHSQPTSEPPRTMPVAPTTRAPVIRRRRRRQRIRQSTGIGTPLQWLIGGMVGIALGLLIVAWMWNMSPQDAIQKLQQPATPVAK